MKISRPKYQPLAKAGPTGTANNTNQLPQAWGTATYAPGFPITPMINTGEAAIPREIDYPIAVNSSIQPRTGYGLTPFESLAAVYEAVTEVRMPITATLRKLVGYQPKLVDKDDNEVADHPFNWMTQFPDGATPFDVWITRFIKSSDIFDAGAFYIGRSDGVPNSLQYIDGSTLFIIVNELGRSPLPNERDPRLISTAAYKSQLHRWNKDHPGKLAGRLYKYGDDYAPITPAYAQVIKGTPFAWYSQDEIWYKPRSRRYDAPYGETFIEQAWTWIMICANITGFELAHYREGNMPEGWWEAPEGWALDRIAAYEAAWNARMSVGPTERMRSRFAAHGMKWAATKKEEFPTELYQRAFNNIIMSYGYPPTEFGEVSSKGLGGNDLGELMNNKSYSDGVSPRKTFVESAFNNILDDAGEKNVRLKLIAPPAISNPEKMRESVLHLVANGMLTINEGLGQMGFNQMGEDDTTGQKTKNSDPNDIGNKHLIISGGKIFVLEDMQVTGGEGAPIAGLNPPAEAALKEPQSPQDLKTIEDVMRTHKLPGAKTYSVPKESTPDAKPAGGSAPGKPGTAPAAAPATQKAGVIKVDLIHDDSDGAMIALYMPAQAAAQLRAVAERSGLPEDESLLELAQNMHITLAYLPSMEMAQANTAAILGCIQAAAANAKPLAGLIGGYGVFNGKDGKKVLYAVPDMVGLTELRNEITANLEAAGIAYGADHGFNPHITLAYFPAIWEIPGAVDIPYIPITVSGVTLAMGDRLITITLGDGMTRIGKSAAETQRMILDILGKSAGLPKPELTKHCGVCEEDEVYFGAPILRSAEMPGDPDSVIMAPQGAGPRKALWKAEGDEPDDMRERLGGPMYKREEAAYLLDRSLGFWIVPMSYVAEVDDEAGAVVHKVEDSLPVSDLTLYKDEWLERAGVLDFAMGQVGRSADTYGMHPDEPGRVVFKSNGYSFPEGLYHAQTVASPFLQWAAARSVTPRVIKAIRMCLGDAATWKDIEGLVGKPASDEARMRLSSMVGDE